MSLPEERGHLRGQSGPVWVLNMSKVPASQLRHLQRHKIARTPPCHQKGKPDSQAPITGKQPGDSRPLAGQHVAASALPGQCLGHFFSTYGSPENYLPLSSLYPEFLRERQCLCLTSPKFSPGFLAYVHLPSHEDLHESPHMSPPSHCPHSHFCSLAFWNTL